MRQGGRWVSNHAEICWPYKEACIFKISLKDGKQVGVKWLDFHCDSSEKKSELEGPKMNMRPIRKLVQELRQETMAVCIRW